MNYIGRENDTFFVSMTRNEFVKLAKIKGQHVRTHRERIRNKVHARNMRNAYFVMEDRWVNRTGLPFNRDHPDRPDTRNDGWRRVPYYEEMRGCTKVRDVGPMWIGAAPYAAEQLHRRRASGEERTMRNLFGELRRQYRVILVPCDKPELP